MKYTHKFVTHNEKTNKFKWTPCIILHTSGDMAQIQTEDCVMEYNAKKLCRIYDLDPVIES